MTTVHAHFLRQTGERTASDSERDLLDRVRRAGSLSRAELTRASGLSAPGAKTLIDGLCARGLLSLGAAVVTGRGQPSPQLSLTPTFAYCFGLSVMVDGLGVALMDFSGALVAERFWPMFPMRLKTAVTRARESIEQLGAEHGIDPLRVFGIGLAMTGPFLGDGLRVNPPLSMPEEWATADLRQEFSRSLGQPVWIDNDANCAASAEALFGAGRDLGDFVYLHFTDGFAGGVVLNGRVLRGAFGNAGELGRLFALAGLERPTLEALRLRLVAAGLELPDLHHMLSAYRPDWPEIDAWIASVRDGLSLTVAALSAVVDPAAIVLGARLPRDLAQRLIAAVAFETAPRRGLRPPAPQLRPSEGPSNAAVVGAATLPFKKHFFL